MASLNVTGMEEVLKQLDKLSKKADVDEIAKKAVEKAKDVVLESTRSAVAASEYGPRSSGSVAASIQVTNARINSFGAYTVARPTGRDANGTRNGLKAGVLEYGTHDGRFPARPWGKRAKSAAEGPCIKIMEEVIKAEMKAE